MITFFYFLKNNYYYELPNIIGNMNKFLNPKQFSKLQFVFWKFQTFSEIQKQNLKWEHFLKFTNIFQKHKPFIRTRAFFEFLNNFKKWEHVYLSEQF